jgi:hypothetical protein
VTRSHSLCSLLPTRDKAASVEREELLPFESPLVLSSCHVLDLSSIDCASLVVLASRLVLRRHAVARDLPELFVGAWRRALLLSLATLWALKAYFVI